MIVSVCSIVVSITQCGYISAKKKSWIKCSSLAMAPIWCEWNRDRDNGPSLFHSNETNVAKMYRNVPMCEPNIRRNCHEQRSVTFAYMLWRRKTQPTPAFGHVCTVHARVCHIHVPQWMSSHHREYTKYINEDTSHLISCSVSVGLPIRAVVTNASHRSKEQIFCDSIQFRREKKKKISKNGSSR